MGICRYCGGETQGRQQYDSELCNNLFWMRYKEEDLAIPGKRPTAMGAWDYIRSWALAFAQGKCESCGRTKKDLFDILVEDQKRKGKWVSSNFFNVFEPFEVHHVIPVYLGGNSSLSNLIVLCKDCHLKAHQAIRISERLQFTGQTTLDSCEALL